MTGKLDKLIRKIKTNSFSILIKRLDLLWGTKITFIKQMSVLYKGQA